MATSGCGGNDREGSSAAPPGETVTAPDGSTPETLTPPPAEPDEPSPTVAPPPETIPTSPRPQPTPAPPAAVPFAWSTAGALVWHETDVEPTALGHLLRSAGFGWVAVFLHDGLAEDPIEDDWVYRFRLASGLPVGGWGVLRVDPEQEVALVDQLLDHYSLDFYIANPELEYEYSGADGPSHERSARSRRFVDAFRAQRPSLPAGVSSYCRPDRHDIDWASWRQGQFVFLPQAYVNDFGDQVAPANCVEGASAFFPADAVHPTVGMHAGAARSLGASTYVDLLAGASTVGFSVYLAETRMTDTEWQAFGAGIAEHGIAQGI